MYIEALIVGEVFSLLLVIMMFAGKKPGWGMLGMIGVILSGTIAGALALDGSINTISGGTTTALASANNQILSDFGEFLVLTVGLTIGEFVITVRRIFRI